MPAYNHERYIDSAVASALAQETDFAFEIVIGEDCSTDRTRERAREWAKRHPETIRLIENPVNLGIWANDQVIINACRGDYIAWLESDDFWTSRKKLQRQVDHLDGHPERSACFTRASCLTDTVPPITWRGGPDSIQSAYTVDDLLLWGHFIPSCTAMFRADLARPALQWTSGTPFLEVAYAIRFALAGPIGFIDEELACFRHHPDGVYGQHGTERNLRQALDAHRLVAHGYGLTSHPAYGAGLARLEAQLQVYLESVSPDS
jgi:glycosyltransferase involved in cell wall biosynthesis